MEYTELFISPSGISELDCATAKTDTAERPRPLVQKNTWRDSLPIDMLLSVVSVLVVAQSSLEILEGLMNNPVCGFSH
jgi:hypothetical protein